MLAALQRLFHERQAQLMIMKNEKLEKLCRALQLERNELRSQMKEVREEGRGGGGGGGRGGGREGGRSVMQPNQSPLF